MNELGRVASLLLLPVILGLGSTVARGDVLYAGTQFGPVDRITSGGVVSHFADPPAGGIYPSGLAFDSAGNLYTADYNANQIDKITPAGVSSVFKALPAGAHPDGLAMDRDGNLYVANHATHQIDRVTPGGTLSPFATLPATGAAAGLAFDAAGNLYVAGVGDDQISRITPSGTVSLFATLPAGAAPLGLAFDGAGNLYAADLVTDEISKVTPDGTVSRFVSLPANAQAIGLAFDSAGNLYEGGVDNAVRKITPAGVVTPFATDANSAGFTFLAFTDDAGRPLAVPVPEPSCAALAAIVSLVVGTRAARRRPLRRGNRVQ